MVGHRKNRTTSKGNVLYIYMTLLIDPNKTILVWINYDQMVDVFVSECSVDLCWYRVAELGENAKEIPPIWRPLNAFVLTFNTKCFHECLHSNWDTKKSHKYGNHWTLSSLLVKTLAFMNAFILTGIECTHKKIPQIWQPLDTVEFTCKATCFHESCTSTGREWKKKRYI